MNTALQIDLATSPTADARLLVEELESWLSKFYTREQRHGLALEAIFQPHIRFFLARENDAPVGCGGVALFKGFGELKRMYVREGKRGRGIADAILARLEAEARGAALPMLKLETGVHQHASLRFYEKSGFTRCSAFPPYTEMAPSAISTSVFMEKAMSR
ncbi:MAG: GNAT family N-acetyltransferase [Rhodospirillaceae bacterium]